MKTTSKYKTLFFTFILSLLMLQKGMAQERAAYTEVNTEIDGEEGNAMRFVIHRADEKTISKAWKSVMKNYRAKVKTPSNKILASEVIIPSIQDEPIEVFAKIEEIDASKNAFIVMFVVNGKAITESENVSAFTAAKIVSSEFAYKMSKEATHEHYEMEAKKMNDLKEQNEELKKTIEKSEKAIEKAKEEIKEHEKIVKESHKKMEEVMKKMEQQEKNLKQAKAKADEHS